MVVVVMVVVGVVIMTMTIMITNNLQERRMQNSVCSYIHLTNKKHLTYLKVQKYRDSGGVL
jgi:hypothetical protein